ncbi:hypothetical protein [Algoriphagus boritolerans]|uniref:hypothetical protein n=1 Tax=Algoriphagus boritolerans TaxID=308111 RepID=UPI002FCDFB3F
MTARIYMAMHPQLDELEIEIAHSEDSKKRSQRLMLNASKSFFTLLKKHPKSWEENQNEKNSKK